MEDVVYTTSVLLVYVVLIILVTGFCRVGCTVSSTLEIVENCKSTLLRVSHPPDNLQSAGKCLRRGEFFCDARVVKIIPSVPPFLHPQPLPPSASPGVCHVAVLGGS